MIGAAVKVMKIAAGEIEVDVDDGKDKAAQELGRKGGAARAAKLSKKRRAEIAKKAAAARRGKSEFASRHPAPSRAIARHPAPSRAIPRYPVPARPSRGGHGPPSSPPTRQPLRRAPSALSKR